MASRPTPRDLFELWTRARTESVDLFDPDAAQWVRGRDAEGDTQVLTALRAIELAAAEHLREQPVEAKLAATLPVAVAGVLKTRNVVRQLLGEAVSELLVIGFRLSDPEFRSQLVERGRAVRVIVVGERGDSGARSLLRDWPPSNRVLVALEGAEPGLDESSVMHGKVIVADRRIALVGSANFTKAGLGRNYEFGVRLTGEVPEMIQSAIDELTKKGWLVPVQVRKA